MFKINFSYEGNECSFYSRNPTVAIAQCVTHFSLMQVKYPHLSVSPSVRNQAVLPVTAPVKRTRRLWKRRRKIKRRKRKRYNIGRSDDQNVMISRTYFYRYLNADWKVNMEIRKWNGTNLNFMFKMWSSVSVSKILLQNMRMTKKRLRLKKKKSHESQYSHYTWIKVRYCPTVTTADLIAVHWICQW